MHPAIPIVGGTLLASLVGLRIRAVLKKQTPAVFNDPSQRPPPAESAAERAKQQEKLVAQAMQQPPPARQFRQGEIIGVDVFPAALELSTMNDVQNPRPGLVKGIVNMKVTSTKDPFEGSSLPEDKAKVGKFVSAVFADQRFFIEPFFNNDGSVFDIPILKAAITPLPDPAGGVAGIQGVMDLAKQAQATAALVAGGGNEFQAQINPNSAPGGLQAQINPLSPVVEQKARVTTNDPAPAGDLIMRVAPSDSAAKVPGDGADKDGIVTILDPNASADGIWAKIRWDGGRRPAATGFAKKKFLRDL